MYVLHLHAVLGWNLFTWFRSSGYGYWTETWTDNEPQLGPAELIALWCVSVICNVKACEQDRKETQDIPFVFFNISCEVSDCLWLFEQAGINFSKPWRMLGIFQFGISLGWVLLCAVLTRDLLFVSDASSISDVSGVSDGSGVSVHAQIPIHLTDY